MNKDYEKYVTPTGRISDAFLYDFLRTLRSAKERQQKVNSLLYIGDLYHAQMCMKEYDEMVNRLYEMAELV